MGASEAGEVRRARVVLLAVLLTHAALVSTHRGEFWPFSIYPMFSRGGRPWSRSLVLDVTESAGEVSWSAVTELDALPGQVLPLRAHGVPQNDLAALLTASTDWSDARLRTLRRLLGASAETRRLLIVRADGRLDDGRGVIVEYTPLVLVAPEGAVLPSSRREAGGGP